MLANIIDMARFFAVNYIDIIVNVAIMVSIIMVVIGFFKPIVFNRINNKDLRRGALALTNLVACFVAALGYFLRNGWSLKYYPIAAVALTTVSILTYYLYETIPGVRKVIGGIGYTAISKVLNVGILVSTADGIEAAKKELNKIDTEIKNYTTAELKKAASKIKIDKDLKGL